MDNGTITHISLNSKYKVVIERAASSTKQIDGFKVEVNGDDMLTVTNEATKLYKDAQRITEVKEVK